MKGSFNTEVEAGGELDLVIGYFTNPMTEGTESFVVSLYSDQNTQYIIDEADSGMVPGIECTLPCKSCLGPNAKTTCTSCHAEGTADVDDFPYLWESTCLETCPEGYYADQNRKCQ